MNADLALTELATELVGRLARDPDTLTRFSRDFGGLVRRTPLGVARPDSLDGLASLVRWAARTGVPLALRGAGHSQAGHTLTTGVVVDLSALQRIDEVRQDSQVIEVEAGASWSKVIEKTTKQGLAPCVLTTQHSTTVGGTLSVGGYGSTSYRYGAQVNNVEYLDVVTGTGEVVRCGPRENSYLFDGVRAGLGQFGVIARAGLVLRRVKQRVRTFSFSYSSASAFMSDLSRLMRDRGATHLLAHLKDVESPQRHQSLRLTAGIEYDPGEEPSSDQFRDLGYDDSLPTHDAALFGENHIFYFRYEDWFGSTDGFSCPWVDHHFEWDDATSYLDAVLRGRYAPLFQTSMSTIIPTAGIIRSAPLAVRDSTLGNEPMLGIGIFPRLPADLADLAQFSIAYDADVKREFKGRRYLYGYCDAATTDWQSEFGEQWTRVLELKRRFDPHGVFNPALLGLAPWTAVRSDVAP